MKVEAAVHDCNPDIPVILMAGHEADSTGINADVSGRMIIRKPLIFNEIFCCNKKKC